MLRRLFGSKSPAPLKFYFDSLSQPCRALEIFLKVARVPYEPVFVNLGKMEHMTEEFEKVNPFKKVPAIDDGGFLLTESVAIFRYITEGRQIADNWYPNDSHKRARVDEYLEWQHIGLRAPCALYVWATFFTPNITGEPVNPKVVLSRRQAMIKACDELNDVWLKGKPYVAGTEISFADILAACELRELDLTDYDPKIGRPALEAWLDRVKVETNPHYDEAHARIDRLAQRKTEKLSKL